MSDHHTHDELAAARPSSMPPPGWYADPGRPGAQRYWDGGAWAPQHREVTEAPPRRRGPSARLVVGISVGVVALLVAGIVAFALMMPRLAGALADLGTRDEPGLETEVPATWTTVPVLDGGGTVAYDPAWEDITQQLGMEAQLESASAQTGVDIVLGGAWLTAGDLVNGGSTLVLMSIPDAGGPSAARVEAHASLLGATAGIEDVVITEQTAVRTAGGYSAYIIEYEHPIYGETLAGTIGVVVEGGQQLQVSAGGLAAYGSGVEQVEAVLNSLRIG
ncbi:DUF2510 domain-containing protein [Demequina activiva]|uniref:DUF2510 domain-containing protein n=1 Tax=Demequina activiva TaxID=1582364 RepID=A0A919UH02_9MICO|nr:DUF2510 domain-containing protein [Demequina activiva]GIG54939.1 hypothetical protein Dac01nite_16910 [Demequina activiva]